MEVPSRHSLQGPSVLGVNFFTPPLALGLKVESLGGIQVAIKLHVSTRALHQQSHRALGRRHGEMTREKSREKKHSKKAVII